MTEKTLFERFQAEAVGCSDLGAHFSDASLEGVGGLLYANGELFIEKLAVGYQLVLNNDCHVSTDLADLERKLFDWATGEGYFDGEA